jgi:hypothetical protein
MFSRLMIAAAKARAAASAMSTELLRLIYAVMKNFC